MFTLIAILFIASLSLQAAEHQPTLDCAWAMSQYPQMRSKPVGIKEYTQHFGRPKRAQIQAAIQSGTPLLFYRHIPGTRNYVELATPVSIDENLEPTVELIRQNSAQDQRVRFRFADMRILSRAPSGLPPGLEKLRGIQPAFPQEKSYSSWAPHTVVASENGKWIQFLDKMRGIPWDSLWTAKVAGFDVFEGHPYAYITDIGGIPGTFEILEWPSNDTPSPQISDQIAPLQRYFQSLLPLPPVTQLISLGARQSGEIANHSQYALLVQGLGEKRAKALDLALHDPHASNYYGANKDHVHAYHVVSIQPEDNLQTMLIELHAVDRSHRTFTTSEGLIRGMSLLNPKLEAAPPIESFRPRAQNWSQPAHLPSFRLYLRGLVEGRHFVWTDPWNGANYSGRPELLVQDAAGIWILDIGSRVKTLEVWESDGAPPRLEEDEETGQTTEIYMPHQIYRMFGGADLPFPPVPSPALSPFEPSSLNHPSFRVDPFEAATEPDWIKQRLVQLQKALAENKTISISIETRNQPAIQFDAKVAFLNSKLVALEPADGSRTLIRPIFAVEIVSP